LVVPTWEEKPVEVILYARKSDPSAKENDPSFEQQEEACGEYAARMGYSVLDRIREAYTGTDLVRQDGLWQAIDAVKRGRAQVVIAYSYDRLSRDTQAQEVVLWEIEKKYGGRFEAATEQIDRDDPLRQMIRASLGAASAIERRRVVDRLARGKMSKAKGRGELSAAANAKYGYRLAEDRTSYLLEDETAETVRRIYAWAEQGHSMRWIAKRLNAEGVPTPGQWAARHGHPRHDRDGVLVAVGEKWRHEQVRRILEDSAYCGRMQVYKLEVTHPYVKNPTTGIMEKRQRVREREEPVTLPERTCPAIVSVEQWERVQAGVATRVKEGRPPLDAEEALFRGHVFCACGRKMLLVRLTSGAYIYVCNRRAALATDASHACPYGDLSIRARLVNVVGENALKTMLEHREDLARILEARMEGARDETLERVTANLQEIVAQKTAQRDRYQKAIGTATDDAFIAKLVADAEALSREIREYEAEIAENKTRLDSLESQRNQFAYVLDHLDAYRIRYVRSDEPPSPEDLRFLADLVGLKLIVHPVDVTPRVEVGFAVKSGTTVFRIVPLIIRFTLADLVA
jgi:site-specific DNA recombinase